MKVGLVVEMVRWIGISEYYTQYVRHECENTCDE